MPKWSSQSTHTDLTSFIDEPEVKKQLRIRFLIAASIIAVIALAVIFGSKPAYAAFRHRQIQKHFEAAEVAARLGDWTTTRDLCRTVLLAQPSNLEAFRLWYRSLSETAEARTYLAAAQMFTDERATEDDKIDALRVMSRQAPQAVAISAYSSLDEEFKKRIEVVASIANVLTYRGEAIAAEKMLRDAPDLASFPGARLELVRALVSIPTRERVDEARNLFAGLIAEGSNKEALECLALLGNTNGGLASGAPLPDLPAWVSSVPEAETLHHLYALHPSIELAGAETDSIFDAAVERFLSVDPGILGTWLVRQNQTKLAVTVLEEPATRHASAFIARLHALLKEQRDAEVEELLKNPPANADLVEVGVVRAIVARDKGDASAERAAWQEVLRQAAFDRERNRFIDIAGHASLLGAVEASDNAWVAAVRVGWGRLPLYHDLIPILVRLAMQGRTDDLLAINRVMSRFEPLNTEVANNVNYLSLIHSVISPAETIELQEALVAREPKLTDYRATLCMAHLMIKDPVRADEELRLIGDKSHLSPHNLAAMKGASAILSGNVEAGLDMLSQVRWRQMLRQEVLCFRNILVSAKVDNLPQELVETASQAEADPSKLPAWRKAVEAMEKDRSGDILPALPAPELPRFEPEE